MSANDAQFVQAVQASLDVAIRRIVEEEAKKAAAETERRVREETTKIIGNVSSWFTHERRGYDLIITVKFPKET